MMNLQPTRSIVFSLFLFLFFPILRAEEAAEQAPFTARLHAGATVTRGNSETTLLTAGANGKHVKDQREWLGTVRMKYGTSTVEEDDGSETEETTVDDAKASLQYNRLFAGDYYGFLKGEGERDAIADLEHRLRAGPGLGIYLIREEDRSFALEAGLQWISEEKGSTEQDYISGILGARITYRLNEQTDTWLTFEINQSLEQTDLYFIEAETGVNANLFNRIGMQVSLRWDYESEPADDAESDDLTLVAGVTYSL